jgi:hypothetical protein
MPKALCKIAYSVIEQGELRKIVFNTGDEVKGISEDLIKEWQAAGCVEKPDAKAKS